MHLELWDSVPNTERVVAEIRVVNGQMQVKERESLPPAIRKDLDFLWRHSTPETFFATLKVEMRGFMWVKLVRD